MFNGPRGEGFSFSHRIEKRVGEGAGAGADLSALSEDHQGGAVQGLTK